MARKNTLFVCILFVLGMIYLLKFPADVPRSISEQDVNPVILEQREPWMTIFVHGSFGSLLSLLSAYNVLHDQVDGTSYKKAVNRLRKDSVFYKDQPLLSKGLVRVDPTFDLSRTKQKKMAAYPLLKVYELVTEYVRPGKEKNFLYTFGWSGLLSQNRRRLEAIRFYNAVSEELERFHDLGVYPKVRVLTHSHGGNVVAYTSAIYEALQGVKMVCKEREDVRCQMRKMLDKMPVKEEALTKKGQKRFSYYPKKADLAIDELIMWGMPVQPETDHLFVSPAFKNVFHFYSDEDLVQRVDWVSTKQGYSDRRFDFKRIKSFCDEQGCFVQSRITVDRVGKREHIKKAAQKAAKKESFWSVLFSGGSLIVPHSKDPTHREMWFFNWHEPRKFILYPIPVAMFSSALVDLVRKAPTLNDFDIDLKMVDNKILFDLVKYDEDELQAAYFIDKSFVGLLTKKVTPWRSEKISSGNLFNMVRKYVDYT